MNRMYDVHIECISEFGPRTSSVRTNRQMASQYLYLPWICLAGGNGWTSAIGGRWSLLTGVYARGSKRSNTARGKFVTCHGMHIRA